MYFQDGTIKNTKFKVIMKILDFIKIILTNIKHFFMGYKNPRNADTLDGLDSTDFTRKTGSDAQTITPPTTFSENLKLLSNKSLKLSTSGYSKIEFRSSSSFNNEANNLIYISEGTKHYFLDDNGDPADIIAGKIVSNITMREVVDEHVDNTAAVAAGLVVGDHYRTGAYLKIVI